MVVALDLEDPSSIEDLGEKVKEEFNRVDILLNVAGILGDGEHEPGPERSLRKLDKKWFPANYCSVVYVHLARNISNGTAKAKDVVTRSKERIWL